jgi:hypothetical protein
MRKHHCFFFILFVLSATFSNAQQGDTLSKNLVPIESLLSKIKPDTSKMVSELDTMKVDTVYIDNPMNVVKIGADWVSAYGMLGITYERVIGFSFSAQLKVELLGKYNPFSQLPFIEDAYDNTISVSGIGLVPEVRYYGTEHYAPKGLFVGFYVPFRYGEVKAPLNLPSAPSFTIPKENQRYTLIGIGFDFGYHIIIKKRVTIEALAGCSIAKGSFSDSHYKSTLTLNGVDFEQKISLKDGTLGNAFYPRVEMCVGWAF